MLLARVFAYADAHRARIGVNYKQIPVNAPKSPVNTYSKDGAMRIQNVADPVYAPNSKGGPVADEAIIPMSKSGRRTANSYTPPTRFVVMTTIGANRARLCATVMDDAARDRLVANVVGHLSDGVSQLVLERAFEYWRNIDKEIGDRIAKVSTAPKTLTSAASVASSLGMRLSAAYITAKRRLATTLLTAR